MLLIGWFQLFFVMIHMWGKSSLQLQHQTIHFCMRSSLQISFSMVSHHVHTWGSNKYFTPAASLWFSSALLVIIVALHMCQCDSPSVWVFVHLLYIHLSLLRSLFLSLSRCLLLSLTSEASECFNVFWIHTQSSMQQHTGPCVCLCVWHIFYAFISVPLHTESETMTTALK